LGFGTERPSLRLFLPGKPFVLCGLFMAALSKKEEIIRFFGIVCFCPLVKINGSLPAFGSITFGSLAREKT
jgi:hypothetical protein